MYKVAPRRLVSAAGTQELSEELGPNEEGVESL